MAQLLPEQLEFDFFAPPAPEKLKQSENKAKSTAFKDTDILKFQLKKTAAVNSRISERTLTTREKEGRFTKKATLINFSLHLRMRLKNDWLQNHWIESGLKRPFSICTNKTQKQRLVFGLSELH